jgi:phosphoserine aminotransferase
MSKKHNFNPGPSIMPDFTVDMTIKALKDFEGTGLSAMEVSHRSKEFDAVMLETEEYVKDILDVPQGYSVIFLGGGASTQFFMVPYNLLNKKAAYLNTGSWGGKALAEAKLFGEAIEVASSADKNYSYIPKGYSVPADADYFHITTNNTIRGTEILEDLDFGVPLVADASSDIFSRPMDVSKYSLLYAGAQKNLGPAGVTLVIIKDEILGKVDRQIPTMVDYRTHISKHSMFNTPPVINVYACLQTLKWIKDLGGLVEVEKRNIQKAKLIYEEIDRNKLFVGTAAVEDRSRMNATFVMTEEYKDLESDFLQLAVSKDIVGIKGHRSVGGFRASLYNALPIESVEVLVNCMKEFEAKH